MSTLHEQLARLRRFKVSVQQADPKLAEESADLGGQLEAFEAPLSPQALEEAVELESIVMRRERPVLAIHENVTKLVFVDQADSEIWGDRLTKARSLLDAAIPCGGTRQPAGGGARLGRHRLAGGREHPRDQPPRRERVRDAQGRRVHVRAWALTTACPPPSTSSRKSTIQATLVFKLIKPLHIEEQPGPDIAFFEVETAVRRREARKADRAGRDASSTTENVATIGYPAYDSRIPEPDLMERIYGKIYNKKRLAPGGVTRVEQTRLWHNCTTLGGNSGSVVLDLDKRAGPRAAFQRQLPRSRTTPCAPTW